MNPSLQLLFERRSIRNYNTAEPISDAEVDDLLAAAMAAPSACAKDPWHFVLIRQRSILEAMADALPNGQMLRQAAMAILVCGDLHKAHDQQLSYMLQDCSAAIENLLLAASILQIGACWLGVHPRPDRLAAMSQMFQLPEAIVPVSAIALGRPAEQLPARSRYTAAAVHHERW